MTTEKKPLVPDRSAYLSEIRFVTLIGLLVNLALTAVKFVAGFLGGSQAVVADAVHSLSDSLTDVVVLVGVKYWSAPADQQHPHGHQRIETIITVYIGLALAAVALGLGYKAMISLREAHTPPTGVALAAVLLSIVVKEALFRWHFSVGKRLRSQALLANAWEHRSDAFGSMPAALAVGVAIVAPGWGFVDRVGAIVASLLILQAAWKIAWPALTELADRGADVLTVEKIRELTQTVAGVREAHAIRTRYLGSGLQVDMHVLVDPQISVEQGHFISECVKIRLLELMGEVLDVIIHIEPDLEEHRRGPDAVTCDK